MQFIATIDTRHIGYYRIQSQIRAAIVVVYVNMMSASRLSAGRKLTKFELKLYKNKNYSKN